MKTLLEKWDPVINAESLPQISEQYRKEVTAQLLENQEKYLKEANTPNITSGIDNWDPVIMGMARRLVPQNIGFEVAGVQPLNAPTSLIFALKARYADGDGDQQDGDEALFNEPDTAHSGAGGPQTDITLTNSPGTTGTGIALPNSETQNWKGMGVTIDKITVTAKARQLRADYSLEMAQDMRSVHGLDADQELINILTDEITAEINRELVRTIYRVGKVGIQWKASGKGTFSLKEDADGRWLGERFKSLLFAIERESNQIFSDTRRGKGNIIIASSDVASALSLAGVLDQSDALAAMTKLPQDFTGPTFAGTINKMKVFVDPFLTVQGAAVGYKGSTQYDAGLFYCPYVPLQLVRATNTDTFNPAIGFKTRYGLVANPFLYDHAGSNDVGMTDNSNIYYRKFVVTDLFSQA